MEFVCFDTEDDSVELMTAGKSGFDKRTTQIAAMTCGGDSFANRGNVTEFLQWLLKRPETVIYAHNLQYDLGNLFGKKLDDLDLVLVGGRLIRAGWRGKIFADSFNIWPMSLKKLGAAFKLEKLETHNMAYDAAYAMRDVEIVREAMLFARDFCQSVGVERLSPTLGGLCVKVWRAGGGRNNHDSHKLSRAAYFGGRVELFKICNDAIWELNGAQKCYSVFNMRESSDVLKFPETESVCWTDINSLYPHVMSGKFPAAMEHYGARLPDYGVARCRVRVPECLIAPLPWRDENGRVMYPSGKFEGVWTVAELREAERRGAAIEKVFEAVGSSEFSEPYKEFMLDTYTRRVVCETDAGRTFFKLLMNNLYGRLGASGVIGRTVWRNERNEKDGVVFGEKVLVNYQAPLGGETNWSHAAYTTSYGRLELLRALDAVGAEKLIYCDTDSCVFDSADGSAPFPTGNGLGEMRVVSREKCCFVYAPKMYRAGGTVKAKGIPARLAKLYTDTGRAEFDLPFKMREAIKFYDRGNSKRLSVWRRIVKQNAQRYDKKKLIGNRFIPRKIHKIGG